MYTSQSKGIPKRAMGDVSTSHFSGFLFYSFFWSVLNPEGANGMARWGQEVTEELEAEEKPGPPFNGLYPMTQLLLFFSLLVFCFSMCTVEVLRSSGALAGSCRGQGSPGWRRPLAGSPPSQRSPASQPPPPSSHWGCTGQTESITQRVRGHLHVPSFSE